MLRDLYQLFTALAVGMKSNRLVEIDSQEGTGNGLPDLIQAAYDDGDDATRAPGPLPKMPPTGKS
jgi:hypothetical protein